MQPTYSNNIKRIERELDGITCRITEKYSNRKGMLERLLGCIH